MLSRRMRRPGMPQSQRGAALAIGLVLLVVLTLLAFSGMNAATTGLVMAGNEQYRKSSSQAAAAGIEVAIANLRNVPTSGAQITVAGRLRDDSDAVAYSTDTRYVGDEAGLPQSSADKFIGLHFEIESAGTMDRRNAVDNQVQGAIVIAPQRAGEPDSFRQVGTGL
jgi:type IV pilus assembly protein PilX